MANFHRDFLYILLTSKTHLQCMYYTNRHTLLTRQNMELDVSAMLPFSGLAKLASQSQMLKCKSAKD